MAQDFGGLVIPTGAELVVSHRLPEFHQFFVDRLEAQLDGYNTTIGQVRLVVYPLPKLGSADFSRSGILHEIEKGNTSCAAQPGFQITNAHGNVLPQPGFGDLSLGNSE